MQNRLAVFAQYLKEVEEKLTELQVSVLPDMPERGKVADALGFIKMAWNAVLETKAPLKSVETPVRQNSRPWGSVCS